MREQVCPSHNVDGGVLSDLRREFPEVLLVLHPFTGRWQAYEAPRGSDWDAERVRRVIIGERLLQGSASWLKAVWWKDRSAPQIFDQAMPARPGNWTIQWLRERELHRHGGGAKGFLNEFEERKRKADASVKAARHDENLQRSYDARKRVRDQMPSGLDMTGALKAMRQKEGRSAIGYYGGLKTKKAKGA